MKNNNKYTFYNRVKSNLPAIYTDKKLFTFRQDKALVWWGRILVIKYDWDDTINVETKYPRQNDYKL